MTLLRIGDKGILFLAKLDLKSEMDRTLAYSTLFLPFLNFKKKKSSEFWDFIAVIYTCQNFIVISSK